MQKVTTFRQHRREKTDLGTPKAFFPLEGEEEGEAEWGLNTK